MWRTSRYKTGIATKLAPVGSATVEAWPGIAVVISRALEATVAAARCVTGCRHLLRDIIIEDTGFIVGELGNVGVIGILENQHPCQGCQECQASQVKILGILALESSKPNFA